MGCYRKCVKKTRIKINSSTCCAKWFLIIFVKWCRNINPFSFDLNKQNLVGHSLFLFIRKYDDTVRYSIQIQIMYWIKHIVKYMYIIITILHNPIHSQAYMHV